MGRDLTVDTITPAELTPDELDLWAGFARADDRYASPYFHPAFTQVAGEVAPGAAVAILHRRGEIVGFFPHQRRGGTVQPIAAPMNDYHGVVGRPDATATLADLPGRLRASALSVNGWIGEAEASEGLIRRTTLQAELSDGWDAYDAGRREAHRKYFKDKDRARRSLERDLGAVTVRRGDVSDLRRLIDLKRRQYRGSGRHDVFACGWTADLMQALLTAREDGFGGRLMVLEAGGAPIAFEYGLFADERYHFWIPAYEAATARYSPGILLSLDTMRQGAGEGFRVFDYGFEGEPYKKYFCDRSETVVEGVVRRDGRPAVAAGRLGLSVRRRWAAIDACETTLIGRARGVAAAAGAVLSRTHAAPVAVGFTPLLVL
ncbi:GNAT family N-acetyltransferase [Caulobacter mirabilis]|uniref:GNAT family N-acetyltransferase n=1 Tax=Caulobacter mirabilis TaxID=69666 RepID=A0A2D2AX41_9CAUL|nr:GNAT family N-acetyltransferase [Caulobacter mirabilis]ATQ42545.1 GNAT family N-acetyltransferase [Caulobacter mirabilis]